MNLLLTYCEAYYLMKEQGRDISPISLAEKLRPRNKGIKIVSRSSHPNPAPSFLSLVWDSEQSKVKR